MKLFLDSADTEEIVKIWETGFLEGVTTNPSLLVAAKIDPFVTIKKICELVDTEVHVQVTEKECAAMCAQAKKFKEISPKIVIKLPCTEQGYLACRELVAKKYRVTMTACYSPMQAVLAEKCGAEYVAPYIGRCADRYGDGIGLCRLLTMCLILLLIVNVVLLTIQIV